MSASATRTSRKPTTSMNGSRSAASTGGKTAFRIAISACNHEGGPDPTTRAREPAATQTAAAPMTHETIDGTSRNRGVVGCQRSCSPYA